MIYSKLYLFLMKYIFAISFRKLFVIVLIYQNIFSLWRQYATDSSEIWGLAWLGQNIAESGGEVLCLWSLLYYHK